MISYRVSVVIRAIFSHVISRFSLRFLNERNKNLPRLSKKTDLIALNIPHRKGCHIIDDVFVKIDDDNAMCSYSTVKAYASKPLKEKLNNSREDSNVENIDHSAAKIETIKALEKVGSNIITIHSIID